MDTANVAKELLSLKCHIFLIWQIRRKSNSLYSLFEYHTSPKVWLQMDEIVGTVSFEKRNIKKLQRAPNDLKLNSNDLVPYIWIFQDCECQIFIRFTLQSAFFKILYILRFSH